jgi:hypothetical protein
MERMRIGDFRIGDRVWTSNGLTGVIDGCNGPADDPETLFLVLDSGEFFHADPKGAIPVVKKYVFTDAVVPDGCYGATYEIWRKDSTTARRHIGQAFGSAHRIKLESVTTVTRAEFEEYVAEYKRHFK